MFEENALVVPLTKALAVELKLVPGRLHCGFPQLPMLRTVHMQKFPKKYNLLLLPTTVLGLIVMGELAGWLLKHLAP